MPTCTTKDANFLRARWKLVLRSTKMRTTHLRGCTDTGFRRWLRWLWFWWSKGGCSSEESLPIVFTCDFHVISSNCNHKIAISKRFAILWSNWCSGAGVHERTRELVKIFFFQTLSERLPSLLERCRLISTFLRNTNAHGVRAPRSHGHRVRKEQGWEQRQDRTEHFRCHIFKIKIYPGGRNLTVVTLPRLQWCLKFSPRCLCWRHCFRTRLKPI